MRFVDTNILLYAISTDPRDAAKLTTARQLLRESEFTLSVQVLQEFFVQSTRVTRAGRIDRAEAVALMNTWSRTPVQPITPGIVLAAIATSGRWQISYWDAAIIEAARASGCDAVLSEDLQHGQSFDGVRIIDPFHTE